MSIGRPSTHTGGEDKTVPADMLLLVGSAIVNEAILTGESTPQWKVLSFHNVIFVCWLLFQIITLWILDLKSSEL